MKRLGIFVFFDREGIVDRYVEYLLKEMNRVLDSLFIVCNGYVNEEGIQKLNKYSSNVYIRENIGFDAGAYKYILIEQKYIFQLNRYDELILFNDTCYGPIYPMDEVFQIMEARKLNFWGMTQYEDKMIKKHAQSYFLVFDKKVMQSQCFYDFWISCDTNTTNVGSIINEFEIQITQALQKHGFKWGTYVNSEEYYGLNPYEYFTDHLIKNNHFPFLKKKRFKYKTLNQGIGNDLAVAMKYIDKKTSYPIELIYENAIRINDVFDLRETLNLNYVITYDSERQVSKEYKAAVFLYLSQYSIEDEVCTYIKAIPYYIDIYIVSSSSFVMEEMQRVLCGADNCFCYIKTEQVEDETAQFFDIISQNVLDYDYCCFLYDMAIEKSTNGTKRIVWDNLLLNGAYIENILETLERELYLGVLTLPYFYHGDYVYSLLKGINQKSSQERKGLEYVEKYLTDIGIHRHINLESILIASFPCFWCKTKALHQLFEKNTYSLPQFKKGIMIDVIAPYLAQANGFYTGQVENTEFASLTLINYENIIRRLLVNGETLRERTAQPDNKLMGDVEGLFQGIINQDIYIYGTGLFGNSVLQNLEGKNVKGFIVSDAYYCDKELKGFPIYKLSEVKESDNMVVIVGMDRKNTEDIKPLLKDFKNVIYLW